MDVTHVMVAADVIGDVDQISTRLDAVVKGSVLTLMCTLNVLVTWWRCDRRLGPTIAAIFISAAVGWAVMDMVVLRDKVGDTVNHDAVRPSAVVRVHDAPERGLL